MRYLQKYSAVSILSLGPILAQASKVSEKVNSLYEGLGYVRTEEAIPHPDERKVNI